MAMRPFSKVPYLPFLSLRPAEMLALEELPSATKDKMLPLIHLRPWTTAFALQSGLDRLTTAYGNRPTVIAVGAPETAANLRPVHRELAKLRDAEGGYRNWCRFIEDEGHEHFIPAVQIDDPSGIDSQVRTFYELGRGLVVIVPRPALGGLRALAKSVSRLTDSGRETCFVLDERRTSVDSLGRAVFMAAHCEEIREACPYAAISISGSSFPDNFKGVAGQEIYERVLFNQVVAKIGSKRMIYSDRGSARVERMGGGGLPMPRIDYPQEQRWSFFRSQSEGMAGYRQMAKDAMKPENGVFDKQLRVWGTLMIERTAEGVEPSIKTPARSTAVRINLHLQRQTFFNDPVGLYETDDDW